MLYLVCDILFAPFAITKTAASLLTIGFKVARRFNFRIILTFLATEALVDEVNEDTLAEVAEADHALEEGLDAPLGLLKAALKLGEDLPRSLDLLRS